MTMTDKIGSVYAIRLKAEDRICYVGQTRQAEPEKRWKQHWYGNRMAITDFLRSVGDKDAFEFIILEQVPVAKLNAREEYWIAELGTMHPRGFNQVLRGVGVSEPTRERISKGRTGKVHSPETRAKLAEAHRRRMSDPAVLAHMRQLQRRSLEVMKEKRGPKKPKPLKVPKPRAARTPEHSAKLAEAARRRWANSEFRSKIAVTFEARSVDPEYRAKLVTAWDRRRARQAQA